MQSYGVLQRQLFFAERFQLLSVCDLYHAPAQCHHAFVLEIMEHTGHDFPVGAEMASDRFVGDF